MTNIEIGMNVAAKLYLHILDNELPTPFEAHKIYKLENSEFGTVLHYQEELNTEAITYIISESIEEINEALSEAKRFRDAALNAIRSMIE